MLFLLYLNSFIALFIGAITYFVSPKVMSKEEIEEAFRNPLLAAIEILASSFLWFIYLPVLLMSGRGD